MFHHVTIIFSIEFIVLQQTLMLIILFFFNQHLEVVIRQKIPSIIALINKTIDEINAELDRIGRPIAADGGVNLPSSFNLNAS